MVPPALVLLATSVVPPAWELLFLVRGQIYLWESWQVQIYRSIHLEHFWEPPSAKPVSRFASVT